jgi:predicted PurR-regulated permease PerM
MTKNVEKIELFKFALEHTQFEYGNLTDAWTRVDEKAQATALIAGVFLAAVFVFLQSAIPSWTKEVRWGFGSVVVCISVTIGLAVLAMLARESSLPPTAKSVGKMVSDVLNQDSNELADRCVRLQGEVINDWIRVNVDIRQLVDKKANLLLWAQRSLLASAGCVSLLTLVILFTKVMKCDV